MKYRGSAESVKDFGNYFRREIEDSNATDHCRISFKSEKSN